MRLPIKMKKIISLLLIASTYGYGQSNQDVKSPNMADFTRYGNIPVKMYTGELDVTVPVMSVPVGNQDQINLALSYNGSGFIPNKRPGTVGLNWNLNGIGAITRQVNGCPDDHIGVPQTAGGTNGRFEHGFMVGMKKLKDANNTLPNGILDGSRLVPAKDNPNGMYFEMRFKGPTTDVSDTFETTPDVFYFNVNGLSGKFFMTSDGKIKVLADQPGVVTVDLTAFNFQPYTTDCMPLVTSEIRLIDENGNKYYFGGESKYLEYALNLPATMVSCETAQNPVINTWCLKRIEYYNGEIVTYNYQEDNINPGAPFCGDGFFKGSQDVREQQEKFFFINESANESRFAQQIIGGEATLTGGYGRILSLHKKAFLDNITGTNFKLQFNYSSQAYVFNNEPNQYCFWRDFKEFKLDNIVLSYNSQQIKKVSFAYSLKGGVANVEGSYPRLFLDSVLEEGKMPYRFEYNIQSNQLLPKPGTCAVDFWGFYNGKPNDAPPFGYDKIIPQSTIDANGDEIITSDIRNPDFNYAKIAMLTKMTYPTGGHTLFEYEAHTYGKRLERRSTGNFLAALYDVSGQAGGVRVRKVTDFDGFKDVNVKEYFYTDANNNSSGILMQWPRVQLTYNFHDEWNSTGEGWVWFSGGSIDVKIILMQSSSINMNSVENSVMSYSRVIEKSIGNGRTVYNFKSYLTTPDDAVTFVEQVRRGTFTIENLVKNSDILLNDRSIERGKLDSKLIYAEGSVNPLQKEEYFYNTDPNRVLLNSQFAAVSNAWRYNSKQYYYNDYLTEKKTTIFNPNGDVVVSEKSVYKQLPNYSALMSDQTVLSKVNTFTSVANETLETEYKYPSDVYASGTADYINFRDANIYVSLRESQFKNSNKLSESFSVFAKDATTNNKLNLKNAYAAKFPNANTSIANGVGQLEKKVTYDFYDTSGNVSQYTTENGMTVSLIWGYAKTAPIAKIENATLAQVASALSTSTATLQTYTEANLTVLNGLRNSLPTAMVTTYTHLPLVGVQTITDSRGNIVTFTYDSVGRLQNIKDKNGNVLTEYKYHYKNQ